MTHKILNLEFLCHPRLVHLKVREVIGDLVRPVHRSFVHKHAGNSCSKGLAVRSYLKDRILIDRVGSSIFFTPNPFAYMTWSSLTIAYAMPGTFCAFICSFA